MKKLFKPHQSLHFLYLIVSIYFVLLFFNLQFFPIVWLDEIMDLDPSARLVKDGNYASAIWPYSGTDSFFYANLPVRQLPHLITFGLFGAKVFAVRLPFILFFLATVVLFVDILKKLNVNPFWITIGTILFITDKAVFESVRSVRCETTEMLLLSCGIWLAIQHKKPIINAFLQSLLALTHPASGVFSLAITLFIWHNEKQPLTKWLIPVAYLFLPTLYFGTILYYNTWDKFTIQFLTAGSHHSSIAENGNLIVKHFSDRFFPYYSILPLTPIIVYVAHIIAFKNLVLVKNTQRLNSILFTTTSLYWLVFLAPQHRYLPPFIMTALLVFIPYIQLQNNKIANWAIIGIITFQFFKITTMHSISFTQKNARNPSAMLEWLNSQTQNYEGKKLIIGEAIAGYYSLSTQNTDYAIPIYPAHFKFKDYENIFFLTRDTLPLYLINKYLPENQTPDWLQNFGKQTYTYHGIHLYHIRSEDEFNKWSINYNTYLKLKRQ